MGIIDQADIKRLGYRFLKRNVPTGVWEEIKCHEAREKVSHALRDRVREQQKPTKRRRKSEESIALTAIAEQMITAGMDHHGHTASRNEKSVSDQTSQKEENSHFPILGIDKSDDESNSFCLDFDMTTHENLSDMKAQRRFSLFSLSSLNQDTFERRGDLTCDDEQFSSKTQRRLSMASLFGNDDLHSYPNKVTPQERRCSLFTILDQDFCSSLKKAVRRCSMNGLFGHFNHENRDDNSDSSNNNDSTDHTVDNDINLLEAIYDISKNLGQEMYSDPFHTMPIEDVTANVDVDIPRNIKEDEDALLDMADAL